MYKLVEVINLYASGVTWWSLGICISCILLLHTMINVRYKSKLNTTTFELCTATCAVCMVLIIWSMFTLLCGISIIGKEHMWVLATTGILTGIGILLSTFTLVIGERDVLSLIVYAGVLYACGLTTLFHVYTNFPEVSNLL